VGLGTALTCWCQLEPAAAALQACARRVAECSSSRASHWLRQIRMICADAAQSEVQQHHGEVGQPCSPPPDVTDATNGRKSRHGHGDLKPQARAAPLPPDAVKSRSRPAGLSVPNRNCRQMDNLVSHSCTHTFRTWACQVSWCLYPYFHLRNLLLKALCTGPIKFLHGLCTHKQHPCPSTYWWQRVGGGNLVGIW